MYANCSDVDYTQLSRGCGIAQGWSSTSCNEFRWWHRLGHGPAMGSKMAAGCLCWMQKLLVFLSYVLIITV